MIRLLAPKDHASIHIGNHGQIQVDEAGGVEAPFTAQEVAHLQLHGWTVAPGDQQPKTKPIPAPGQMNRAQLLDALANLNLGIQPPGDEVSDLEIAAIVEEFTLAKATGEAKPPVPGTQEHTSEKSTFGAGWLAGDADAKQPE